MADETVRLWLVERDYDDKGLLRLVYATDDGRHRLAQERSPTLRQEVTAAIDVDVDRLDPVEDPEDRERYAAEVTRVRDRHDPDEVI